MPTLSRKRSKSSPPWSDLTPLVLERIRDILDSNLYDIRLRSVCSNWRTSLTHPHRFSDFPIRLPRLPRHIQDDTDTINTPTLSCSRVYKISPADNPSNGWLLKSSDTKPNTFTLLSILSSERVSIIRSSLDLLRYRVSEVCKCYHVDVDDATTTLLIRKVILLPHFVDNTNFTVVLVSYSGEIWYFDDGDSVWRAIDRVKDYRFKDVILFKGLCYAVDEKGLLVSIDSAFRLTKVLSPPYYLVCCRELVFINLVASLSDLFLVVVVVNVRHMNEADEVHVFKWMFHGWCATNYLGKDTVLLSSHEVSAAVSARDFVGCKENRVYFSYPFFSKPYFDEEDEGYKPREFDVYDLDKDEVIPYKVKPQSVTVFWPPPIWMQLALPTP